MESITTDVQSLGNGTESKYSVGAVLVYGLLGKCVVTAIESRDLSGARQEYYKLELQKPSQSRSSRPGASIWVPVKAARQKGLRMPLGATEVQGILELLGSSDYFFSQDESLSSVMPHLEASIISEGANGLAKVVGFLGVIKSRRISLPADISKFLETATKLLVREMSEALARPSHDIYSQLDKLTKVKIHSSH